MKMDDIARIAGVSKASVSRVLNNKANVSVELKEKVEAVMKTYGYVPNLVAQALNTNRTKLIGVLLPSIGLDVFSDMVKGIGETIGAWDYELILVETKGDIKKCETYLEILQRKQVDGIIYFPTGITPEHKSVVKKIQLPLVVLGYEAFDKPTISFKDEALVVEMTDQLLKAGHQRIGFIGMPQGHLVGDNRMKGYKKAMESHGLAAQSVYADDLTYEAGYRAMSNPHFQDCTAIFGAMDRLTIGAMSYLSDQKKALDSFAFAGVDDMSVSKMVTPKLSSVAMDYVKSGQVAGEMILGIIQERDVQNMVMGYEIIIRESMKEV